MSATPTNPNGALARLEAEGFRLQIVHGDAHHLLVQGIPAATPNREVLPGTLYCPLDMDPQGNNLDTCASHQCWWIGERPCDASGRVMTELISNDKPEKKGDDIETTVAFSRMPVGRSGYRDLHEKIWTYVRLIWDEARQINPNCDPRSQKPIPAVVQAQQRVFLYPDMATTRAGIGAAMAKLLFGRVGIIGIGGTGSYILDLLAKTPIDEVHIYDGDRFKLHNPFRSPGAPRREELTEPMKVDWFGDIYDRMRRGIVRHPYNVGAAQIPEFTGFSFVFVAIDDPEARKVILEGLMSLKVRFIDVAIDVAFDPQGCLRGMCRFTVGTPDVHGHIKQVVSYAKVPEDDLYRNIQVADMNMLNAAMAVMKWKKTRGFYADDIREHHSLYTVATHGLTKEDRG